MKKAIFFSLVIIASFTLSSCTIKDRLKNKVLDKVDQKVAEERAEDMTDDQLLKDLDSDTTSTDDDINALEADLK